jgi:antitoxin component YwqK of YwqJK toxin-antitoxin module
MYRNKRKNMKIFISTKTYILVLILVLTNLKMVAAQTYNVIGTDTINIVDVNGKKQGKWVVTNAVLGKECYAEDQKVEEGKFADSKKTGFWKEYFCNNSVKSKIYYDNNRPNGYAVIYHENGKIKEEGVWKNNRWTGTYKLYYPNGQVQQSFNFNAAGKREGKQTYFYENGQVMIEGSWEGGKEAGEIKEYYENGDVKAIQVFNGGIMNGAATKTFEPKRPIAKSQTIDKEIDAPIVVVEKTEKDNLGKMFNGEGYWQLYNRNKQVTKDGVFQHNRFMDGKAYFYDENGLLLRVAIYKNGTYVGDGVVNDE